MAGHITEERQAVMGSVVDWSELLTRSASDMELAKLAVAFLFFLMTDPEVQLKMETLSLHTQNELREIMQFLVDNKDSNNLADDLEYLLHSVAPAMGLMESFQEAEDTYATVTPLRNKTRHMLQHAPSKTSPATPLQDFFKKSQVQQVLKLQEQVWRERKACEQLEAELSAHQQLVIDRDAQVFALQARLKTLRILYEQKPSSPQSGVVKELQEKSDRWRLHGASVAALFVSLTILGCGRLQEVMRQNQELRKENAISEHRVDTLKDENGSLSRKLADAGVKLSESRTKLHEVVSCSEGALLQKATECVELKTQLQTLLDIKAELEERRDILEAKVAVLVEQLEETRQEVACGEVLGDAIQMDSLKQEIATLVNTQNHHNSLVQQLQSDKHTLQSIIDENDRQLELQLFQHQNTVMEFQRELDLMKQNIKDLERKADQRENELLAEVEENKISVEKLQRKLEQKEEDVICLEKVNEQEICRYLSSISKMEKKIQNIENEKLELSEQIKRMQEERHCFLANESILKEEREMLRVKISDAENEKQTLLNAVSDLAQERNRLIGKLSLLQEESECLGRKVVGLEQEKECLVVRVTGLEEEKGHLVMRVSDLEEEKEGLVVRVAHLEEEKKGLVVRVAGLEEEKESLLVMVNGLDEEKGHLVMTVNGLENEKEGIVMRVAALEEEKETLERDKEGLLMRVAGLEEEKEGLVVRVAGLENEKECYVVRVAGLEEEKEGLVVRVAGLENEKEGLVVRVAGLVEEKESLIVRVAGLHEEKGRLVMTVTGLEKEKEGLLMRVAGLEQEKRHLVMRVADLEEEMEGLVVRVAGLEQDKQCLVMRVAALEEEKESLERDKEGLVVSVTGLEEEKEGLAVRVAGLENEKEGLVVRVADLEEEKEGIVMRVAGLDEEKGHLVMRVADLEEEKERLVVRVAGLHEEKGHLVMTVTGLEKEKEGILMRVAGLEQEKEGLVMRVAALEEKKESLERDKEGLVVRVTGLEEEKEGLVVRVAGLEEEKEGLVVRVADLEEEKEGIVMRVAGLDEEKGHLVMRVAGLEEEKEGLVVRVAGLEEEKEGLVVRVADLEEEKEGLVVRVADLEEEKERLVVRVAGLEEEKEGLVVRVADLEEEKEGLVVRFADLEEEKERLVVRVAGLEEEKEGLVVRVADLEEEKECIVMRVAGLDEEKGHLVMTVTGLENEKECLVVRVAGLEEEKEGLVVRVAGLDEEKGHLVMTVTGLEKEKGHLAMTVAGLEEEKEGLVVRVAGIEEEKERLVVRVAGLEEEKECIVMRVAGLDEEKGHLVVRVAGLENENESLVARVAGLEEEKEGLVVRVAGLDEEKGHLVMTVTGLEKEKRHLAMTVADLEEEKEGLVVRVTGLEEEKGHLVMRVAGLEEEKENEGQLLISAVSQRQEELEKTRKQLEEKEALENNLNARIQDKHVQCSSFEDTITDLNGAIMDLQSRCSSLLGDNQKIADKYEIQLAQERYLQNKVHELKNSIFELKEQHAFLALQKEQDKEMFQKIISAAAAREKVAADNIKKTLDSQFNEFELKSALFKRQKCAAEQRLQVHLVEADRVKEQLENMSLKYESTRQKMLEDGDVAQGDKRKLQQEADDLKQKLKECEGNHKVKEQRWSVSLEQSQKLCRSLQCELAESQRDSANKDWLIQNIKSQMVSAGVGKKLRLPSTDMDCRVSADSHGTDKVVCRASRDRLTSVKASGGDGATFTSVAGGKGQAELENAQVSARGCGTSKRNGSTAARRKESDELSTDSLDESGTVEHHCSKQIIHIYMNKESSRDPQECDTTQVWGAGSTRDSLLAERTACTVPSGVQGHKSSAGKDTSFELGSIADEEEDDISGRIAELQSRNMRCAPHMKSSYPVETQTCVQTTDEQMKQGDPVETLRRASMLSCTGQERHSQSLAPRRFTLVPRGHVSPPGLWSLKSTVDRRPATNTATLRSDTAREKRGPPSQAATFSKKRPASSGQCSLQNKRFQGASISKTYCAESENQGSGGFESFENIIPEESDSTNIEALRRQSVAFQVPITPKVNRQLKPLRRIVLGASNKAVKTQKKH
ncbi:uncharacterized protein LOC144936326 [Lampetra fluviatilis]